MRRRLVAAGLLTLMLAGCNEYAGPRGTVYGRGSGENVQDCPDGSEHYPLTIKTGPRSADLALVCVDRATWVDTALGDTWPPS